MLKAAKMSRGFSLIELMIAMAVLAVGLLGGILVIAAATASNGRSKLHTQARTMAASTLERIVAIPQNATGLDAQTKITDCAGNTFTIQTAPGGSPLINSGAFAGSIDFSQAPVQDYSMAYAACSPTAGAAAGATFDVRWRIDAGATPSTQLVTVSAKTIGSGAALGTFTLPVTLRTLRGNF